MKFLLRWLLFTAPTALLLTGCFERKVEVPPLVPDYSGHRIQYPGTIVARDLVTPDLAASVAFYRALFGWSFREIPNGRAAVAELDGKVIAVFFEKTRQQGPATPALWIPSFSVEALDPPAARLRRAGGSIINGPFELPRRGETVVVSDPEGAVFALLVSETGDPLPGRLPAPWAGDILASNRFSATLKTYESVFGLTVAAAPVADDEDTRRSLLMAGKNPVALVVSSVFENIEAAWLPVVNVPDLEATAAQAEALGALILLGNQEDVPRDALLVQDPAGGLFVIQKRKDEPNATKEEDA